MPIVSSSGRTPRATLEELCEAYRVDPWHLRNSLRRPLYQDLTTRVVARVAPLTAHIVEIGCGIGDVLELLWETGFHCLTGIERDEAVWAVARDRLARTRALLVRDCYPCSLRARPDILVCVNCVYCESSESKEGYFDTMRRWMTHAGEPLGFLVELVNDSYLDTSHSRVPGQPSEFPLSCRVSPIEVAAHFPDYDVFAVCSSEPNRIPKTLYYITRSLESHRLDGLMEGLPHA